jgi:hypothetical protein
MTINSTKELKALIKLCRSMGVDSITVDGITLTLGHTPPKKLKTEKSDLPTVEQPSDDDLLFWSSGGISG